MTLACISTCRRRIGSWSVENHDISSAALVIPAAYHSMSPVAREADEDDLSFISTGARAARDPAAKGLLALSRGTAILLLIVYVAYLVFQVSICWPFYVRCMQTTLRSSRHTKNSSMRMAQFRKTQVQMTRCPAHQGRRKGRRKE